MRSIAKEAKWGVAAVYASGTATVKASATGFDTSGYENVAFILSLATIATGATTSFKVQESNTAVDDAGFTDITSATATTIADDDDNQLRIVEVRPTKKYVRGLLTKDATNAVGGTVLFCMFNGDDVPITQSSDVEVTYVP